jgi:hypothetical protein
MPLGQEIRLQRDLDAAEAEAAVADAVAVGRERKGGCLKRTGRAWRHRPQHFAAFERQRGERAADIGPQLGLPAAAAQRHAHWVIGSSKPGTGRARASSKLLAESALIAFPTVFIAALAYS